MSRIFISYKRVDKEKVFKIKDQIESALGEKCWIDFDGIESDAQFENVIINAINTSEIVIFMYSRHHADILNFDKDWTIRELNYAEKRNKRIVFVNIDSSPLSDRFEFRYSTKQQVDATSPEALAHLISDLKKWLDISIPSTDEPKVSTTNNLDHNNNALNKVLSFINVIRTNTLLYLGLTLVLTICVALPIYNYIINAEDMNSTLSERYRSIVHTEFSEWAVQKNADSRYLFLVDYSIPSNQDRFFIWDTQSDRIVEKFWCTHGFGGHSTPEKPEFSNTLGSNCSSLGWFLVDRETGVSQKYGYSYHAVEGLSPTNSNARSRGILIHTWSSVDKAFQSKIQHPMDKHESQCAGNFITTTEGYKVIDRYIRLSDKQILLYAFDGGGGGRID